jgi:hypothetical protein
MRRKFEAHIKGQRARRRPFRGQGRGQGGRQRHVDALLAVHEKNAATVVRSFKGEAGLRRRWIRRVGSLLIGMRRPVSSLLYPSTNCTPHTYVDDGF